MRGSACATSWRVPKGSPTTQPIMSRSNSTSIGAARACPSPRQGSGHDEDAHGALDCSSDSSAGAGLQADLKTFSALGVYGTVVTAVTAQNTLGVTAVHVIPAEIITAQLDAVFSDLSFAAVKTGMLGSEGAIEAVASSLEKVGAGYSDCRRPRHDFHDRQPTSEAGAEKALIEHAPDPARLPDDARERAGGCGAARPTGGPHRGRGQEPGERLMLLALRPCLSRAVMAGRRTLPTSSSTATRSHTYSRAQKIATANTHGTGCAGFSYRGLSRTGPSA